MVSENGGIIKFNDTNTYLGGFYWSKTDDATGYVWECIPYNEGGISGYQLRRTPSPAGAWPGDYLYISDTDTDLNRVASNGLIGDNFQDWAYAVWELWTEDDFNAYNSSYDVNNDGMVNVTDVIKLVNIILNNDNDYNHRRADVNNDCLINITDVATLVNYILGN